MATIIISLVFCLSLSSVPAYAAVFNVASGDVTGLIPAINAANSNGEENTINLEPGTYTLIVNTLGISSAMTINGESAETTVIERDAGAPPFRIISIAGSGKVTINGLTVRGGRVVEGIGAGAGIINGGRLTINRSIIDHNTAQNAGGGILNLNGGILTLSHTLLTRNLVLFEGAAISNGGTASIIRSSVTSNAAEGTTLWNEASGLMTIHNSTISHNGSDFGILGTLGR